MGKPAEADRKEEFWLDREHKKEAANLIRGITHHGIGGTHHQRGNNIARVPHSNSVPIWDIPKMPVYII